MTIIEKEPRTAEEWADWGLKWDDNYDSPYAKTIEAIRRAQEQARRQAIEECRSLRSDLEFVELLEKT